MTFKDFKIFYPPNIFKTYIIYDIFIRRSTIETGNKILLDLLSERSYIRIKKGW